ncbi:MAG: CocE/NonD family hydrolase [Alphaproteobacteria bacterium]|nr:CocE/NonD family hydrolase [Alphaproteobacteria bacterium]
MTAPLPLVAEQNLECVTRDSTILRADVYRPAGDGRYPVLINRTPYGKHEPRYIADAKAVAARGYVMVIQDERGRYASDGEYRWMFRERGETTNIEDGYDAAEWAAKLPWSDGRLGTWGHSNASYLAWMLCASQPPSLKAFMASGMGERLLSMNFGIFETGRRLEWVHMMAADARRRAGDPTGPHTAAEASKIWNQVERSKWIWYLPLGDIPAKTFSTLNEQLQAYHRTQNIEFMRFGDFHPNVTTPVMLMTGWWDRLIGTMEHFTGLEKNGPAHLKGQHRMIVGPWIHDVTGMVPKDCGLDFGPDADRSYSGMIARWYDLHFKGIDDGLAKEAPVQLFVIGANKWRGESEWPLSRAKQTAFHLHSRGQANTVRGDGVLSLAPPAQSSPTDRYVFDPRDPVMSLMRADSQAAPVDQAPHDHRRDILVYQTAPLRNDIEVIGSPVLTLWASTDGPDTDWTAKLALVNENGLAINLTYGILRAQFRNGFDRPSLLEPNATYEFTVPLNPIAVLFKRGQRIRLYVSSSDFPNFDRNHNTGRDYWSDPELRPARQTVFHDVSKPSRLTLPVITES